MVTKCLSNAEDFLRRKGWRQMEENSSGSFILQGGEVG